MPSCYRCQEWKPAEEFSNGNNRCRPCHKEYQAERRSKMASIAVTDRTGTKVCSTCGVDKPKTEYNVAKGIKDGLQPQCNSCRKISRKRYNDSLKGRSKTLVRSSKNRAKDRDYDHTIDHSFVERLWQEQNGICAVTGAKMVLENNSSYSKQSRLPNGPSLDRIDSNQGYVEGNVQLTTNICNTTKNRWNAEVFLQMAVSITQLHGYTVTPLAPNPTPAVT